MSDARTRALEAAAQRGEPGATEALARARCRAGEHVRVFWSVNVAVARVGLVREITADVEVGAWCERCRAPLPDADTVVDARQRILSTVQKKAGVDARQHPQRWASNGSRMWLRFDVADPETREWIACTVCEGRGVLFTGPDPSNEILCQACRGSGDER